MRLHLWLVPWNGGKVPHFTECVEALSWCLRQNGASVTRDSRPADDRLNFVIGANILEPGKKLPPSAIIVNMEQIPDWRPHLPALYRGHQIWNYEITVHDRFRAAGLDSYYVPFGWTPMLREVDPTGIDTVWDVAFVGQETPYRQHILQSLRARGLNVFSSSNTFGPARENVYLRSKVCLSLRSFDNSPFMPYRILPMWGLHRCVAMDRFDGQERYDFGDALSPLDGDDLVNHIVDLCRDDARRLQRAEAGYRWLINNPYLPHVHQALERWRADPLSGLPVPTSCMLALETVPRRMPIVVDDTRSLALWMHHHRGDRVEQRDGVSWLVRA